MNCPPASGRRYATTDVDFLVLGGYYQRMSNTRAIVRLVKNIRIEGECWVWTSSVNIHGYAQTFGATGKTRKTVSAHRLSYELLVGDIPTGATIDHLCRNRKCINPLHLEPVSMADNLRRAAEQVTTINANKTHCLRGHPFDTHNTVKRLGLNGHTHRICRQCRRIRGRVHALKRRERLRNGNST